MSTAPIAQGPVDVTVGPVAWADDKAIAGHVGNVVSAAAKTYWEKSNWADRESAKRLRHPLFSFPQNDWKPIDTAPHDKRVMVWSGQEMYCAHWAQNPMNGDEAWIVAEWGTEGDQALVKPTHWSPLPLPPNVEGKGRCAKLYRAASSGGRRPERS